MVVQTGTVEERMAARPLLSQSRRTEILEAATRVIAERGLGETRIVDVARHAGTSAALVLYYFQSKDRLLTEALAYADDRFYLETFHELTGRHGARERLALLIDRSFPDPNPESATLSEWRLWLELWSRALRDPLVAQKRQAVDRRWRSAIADVVRDGQRAGEFASDDPDAFAFRLTCLIDGLAVQAILRDPAATPDAVRRAAMEMAERELGLEDRTGQTASDAEAAEASPRRGTGPAKRPSR
jgi:AcrR family transcriptional regulator